MDGHSKEEPQPETSAPVSDPRAPAAFGSRKWLPVLSWPQIAALLLLTFVAGGATMHFQVFPGVFLRDALAAAQAYWKRFVTSHGSYNPELWKPARHDLRGVKVHDRAKAFDGYTLLATGAGAKAVLIDNEGHVLHSWQKPYHDLHDESAGRRHPVPESSIHFRDVQALPGGELVALYEGVGDTPWGYGIVKLDKNSNVLWKNLGNFHHKFDFTPGGGIVALRHHIATEPFEDTLMPVPYMDDEVVWLDARGREQKKLSILAALRYSPYHQLTTRWSEQFFGRSDGDYMHPNDVEYIDEREAKALGFAQQGDVLVSLRAMNLLVLIAPRSESVRWAKRGSWVMQHDPDVLENGNILMFDNLGDLASGGSRVIEFDPRTDATLWEFKSREGLLFHSYIRSAVQSLPNGNVLISESDNARVLEVTRDKEIVWDYFVKERRDGRFPILSDATKYPKTWFTFLAAGGGQ